MQRDTLNFPIDKLKESIKCQKHGHRLALKGSYINDGSVDCHICSRNNLDKDLSKMLGCPVCIEKEEKKFEFALCASCILTQHRETSEFSDSRLHEHALKAWIGNTPAEVKSCSSGEACKLNIPQPKEGQELTLSHVQFYTCSQCEGKFWCLQCVQHAYLT